MTRSPRILILGASGQLGVELKRAFAGAGELLCYGRGQLDLAAEDAVRQAVRSAQPDLILNAAAYTAVDRAESEPDAAMAVNATAPRVLAEEARRRDILLAHYSTDYVFDGSKAGPWLETDPPHPLNAYGAGKLAGEESIAAIGGKFLIFRTSWVYGPHGKNFLLTMLRLARERSQLSIVDDQTGAPTTSVELANATRTIVEGVLAGSFGPVEQWAGLYHMTCGGATTWCGFAKEIFAQAPSALCAQTPQVVGIPSSEYPTPATRPRNSVLSNEKLNARFQVRLNDWKPALAHAIAVLASRA